MSIDTQLEIYLSKERKSIFIEQPACQIYSQCCDSTLLKFLSFLPVTNRKKKNVAIYNGMFCVEWFLLTSHHFKGFARTIRLAQAETAQLLVRTASGFKSLQGFKNRWCYSICILKKTAEKQTKQMLKMHASTLFQSIASLHSYIHLGDIIRHCTSINIAKG